MVRNEERRRSDKGTKRKGVAQAVWPHLSAKQLLVCGFCAEGSSRKMKSLRLCKLVYLNLICLEHLALPIFIPVGHDFSETRYLELVSCLSSEKDVRAGRRSSS